MSPEERAETLIRRLGQNPALAQPVADAIRAAVKDATLETMADMLDALRLTQADTCSLHCPSVKKTGEEWTHSERCKTISDVITKAEADMQIV